MELKNRMISILRQHEVSEDRKSLGIYLFSVISLLILVISSSFAYTYHPVLSYFFCIPIGIFLCRLFVIEHDCGHYSFFANRFFNKAGGFIVGFFTLIPIKVWNNLHDAHHGTVGNLDKRNKNTEWWTMTVDEYLSANWIKRYFYRIVRSKIIRLIFLPCLFMIFPRIPFPKLGYKINISILFHDILYAGILYIILINELFPVFLVAYIIPLFLMNLLASIMLYLQHQFEDTSWEHTENWDLYYASIHGTSYVKVGRFMRWVTGNVGCHHIHHINTRIPSYKLHLSAEEVSPFVQVNVIYLKELFHHLNCVLWDEQSKKLIPFNKIKDLV